MGNRVFVMFTGQHRSVIWLRFLLMYSLIISFLPEICMNICQFLGYFWTVHFDYLLCDWLICLSGCMKHFKQASWKTNSKHCTSPCKCTAETITTLKFTKRLKNCDISANTWYPILSCFEQCNTVTWEPHLFILFDRLTGIIVPRAASWLAGLCRDVMKF